VVVVTLKETTKAWGRGSRGNEGVTYKWSEWSSVIQLIQHASEPLQVVKRQIAELNKHPNCKELSPWKLQL
jgi:hypothetical protein